MKLRGMAILFATVLTVLACGVLAPTAPTPTPIPPPPPSIAPTVPVPPTSAPAATASTLPSGSGPCMAASAGGIDLYTRPSLQADIFSTIMLTPAVELTSRSADGWLGFEPGVAQAANMGVFRLRWIAPGAAITLTGNCAAVPVAAWVPSPGVCYEMVMEAVQVHVSADANSAATGTLNPGDFAAVVGKSASGWLSVSGDQANAPGVNGFIPESETNFNGACDSIPTVPG